MILDATEILFQEHFTQDYSLRKLRTHSHWAKANAKAKKIKKPGKEIKQKTHAIPKHFTDKSRASLLPCEKLF